MGAGRVDTDLPFQFLPWREFGFRESQGQPGAMNPHIFAGTAILRRHAIGAALPAQLAVHGAIAATRLIWKHRAERLDARRFHVLVGVQRRLQPFAAFVSAAILMFCALTSCASRRAT